MSGKLQNARKKIASSQILIMTEYFEKYPGLVVVGNKDIPIKKKDELWENLKDILNSDLAGSRKSVERWQKSWSDVKQSLRKKYQLHLKKPREVFLKDVELRLLKIIGDKKGSVPTLPIKMESCDSSEIKITSVESQQESSWIKAQEVVSTNEQPQQTETSAATIEDIQPTISDIQPRIINNDLPINQNPIVNNNQKQDSGKSLTQFLDTVYFYCKQPTFPALLVTTQNNPQPNIANNVLSNPDKSCSTSISKENSGNDLPTTFDKSTMCNTNQQDSDCPILALQDKPGKRQYSDVIVTDNQDKPNKRQNSDIIMTGNPEKPMTYGVRLRNLLSKEGSNTSDRQSMIRNLLNSKSKEESKTSNSQRKVRDLLNSKSSSKEESKTSDSQSDGSVEKLGFFSCQMMSARALQTIAKELEVKNDIERKRLELEERKIKAFEMIAQKLQM